MTKRKSNLKLEIEPGAVAVILAPEGGFGIMANSGEEAGLADLQALLIAALFASKDPRIGVIRAELMGIVTADKSIVEELAAVSSESDTVPGGAAAPTRGPAMEGPATAGNAVHAPIPERGFGTYL